MQRSGIAPAKPPPGRRKPKSISAYRRNIYSQKVAPVARKQGFGFSK
jgi:hypothetical protein